MVAHVQGWGLHDSLMSVVGIDCEESLHGVMQQFQIDFWPEFVQIVEH